jgi:hypothetical protein
MASEICPKCGAIMQAGEQYCLECGVDIVKARRELAEREKRDRAITIDPDAAAEAAAGARAGVAVHGETSEKVRLKTFDKQLAQKLVRERVAVIVTAALGLIAGLVILGVGVSLIRQGGGLAVVRQLSYGDLRERGLGAFADLSFTGCIVVLIGLGGLLCALGQSIRVATATRAIAAAKRGERPPVVAISPFTKTGLLVGSLLLPPFGLILGIIFKLGQDEETRRLGGSMIWAAVICMAVVGAHLLWNVLAGMAGPMGTTTPPGNAASS